MTAGNTALVKAFMELAPGTEGGLARNRLEFRFNPKEYSVSKQAEWGKTPARGAKKAPKPEFLGTGPRTMQLEMFLDGWERGDPDVSKDVEVLFSWMCPTPQTATTKKPKPPVVVFHWGTTSFVEAALKQASAKYTMFLGDGTPVRATATISLEELPAKWYAQNPTSGGSPGQRVHIFSEGDTLQSISYREYADPNLWRGLADANGVDDPSRIAPGTQLFIPSLEESMVRSSVGGGV